MGIFSSAGLFRVARLSLLARRRDSLQLARSEVLEFLCLLMAGPNATQSSGFSNFISCEI